MSPTVIRRQPPQPLAHGPVRSAYLRFRHLIFEFGKFGTVGAVAFLIDTALYTYLLGTQHLETLTAKTLSTTVAATAAFAGNRLWTWRHRERSGLAREYILYFLFNGVGLLISLAIVAASHYGLGSLWPSVFHSTLADLVATNIVGMAFGTLFRFWSYRRFVFPAPRLEPGDVPQVQPAATESS